MNIVTWRRLASTSGALALCLGLAACGGGDDEPEGLERRTGFGSVEGLHDEARGAYAWLGIPYAAPPVGALRWRPPADPAAWSGTRAAQAFGRSCAQPGSFYAPPKADDGFSRDIAETFGQLMGAEDCLTLSIWRPANDDKDLPVVVWLHGGANTVGYTSNPGYNGANFARLNNVVVVSVNYRLGVFGWLRHPALRVEGDALTNSGNFGTLDQIKALEFVQRNAKVFGGSPGNVTLMGQSAGAVDAYSMMLSPLTKDRDLFHKVVAMSGGIRQHTLAEADTYAQSVLPKVLVLSGRATSDNVASVIADMTPEQVTETLRTVSADVLVLTSSGQADNIGEGTVLPVDPEAAVAAGAYRNVPLMVGLTGEEGKTSMQSFYQVDDAERFRLMYDFDPDRPDAPGAATVQDILKPGVTLQQYEEAAAARTAANAGSWTDHALHLLQPHQPATYAYHFTWAQGPEPWKTLYGAGHGMDVPLMFGNFGKGLFSVNYTSANRAGREAMSNAMMLSVGAFMRNGDPNTAALGTTWLPWTPGAARRLEFDASPTDKRITMR